MLFVIGFFVGAVTFYLIQVIDTKLDAYKDRKQAEFEAAVRAEAEYRAQHSNRHPSNVRRLTGTDDTPYRFDDDPFRDV